MASMLCSTSLRSATTGALVSGPSLIGASVLRPTASSRSCPLIDVSTHATPPRSFEIVSESAEYSGVSSSPTPPGTGKRQPRGLSDKSASADSSPLAKRPVSEPANAPLTPADPPRCSDPSTTSSVDSDPTSRLVSVPFESNHIRYVQLSRFSPKPSISQRPGTRFRSIECR